MRYKKMPLDPKSFIIATLLTLIIVLFTGASSKEIGRYTVTSADNYEKALFVTDTTSGHTWYLSRNDTIDYGTPQQRTSIRTTVTPVRR
jgi:lipocalin